jgi:ABC-type uncharacterized transport system involved in gliding motility auxiliary subunit
MELIRHFRKWAFYWIAGSILIFTALASSYIRMGWGMLEGLSLIAGIALWLWSGRFLSKLTGKVPLRSFIRRAWMITYTLVSGVLFYILINVAALKNDVRFDLTRYQQHTLQPATKKLLSGLSEDVRFTAFFVGIPPKYLEDLLESYQRYSLGKIETEIVDPLVDLGYAAQFGNVISGKESKVIVQAGNMRRDVDFSSTPLDEEMLNNALIQVTRKERRAYFLSGHGEFDIDSEEPTGLSTLAALLQANNIVPRKLLLESGDIPLDCDVLIIAGAKDFLSDKEFKRIEEYLQKGGDALFLVEHTVITTPKKPLSEEEIKKNPSLNEILNNWGLDVKNDIVVDLSSHASGDVGSPATKNYLTHRAVVQGLDYTFYVRPRSIGMLSNHRPTVKYAPFVLTQSDKQSWGETNRMLEVKFNEEEDRPGPVPIAFVVWEPKAKDDFSDTRLAVFTDADFLSNAYIGSYSNAAMGVNVINWLTEVDYQSFLKEENLKIERLDLTSQQKRIVVVFLLVVPVLIGGVGILVWIRRNL